MVARLDRLAPAREVAQIGAALGRQFSHELIGAVASMPQPQLDGALAQLVGAALVYRYGVPPDAEYTFKHALVQDAAYQSMLKSRRAHLHARIADVLERSFPELAEAEPETLARHLAVAALAQRAIPYWVAAGRRAYESWALREAIIHLDSGIGLLAQVQDETAQMELELDLKFALGLVCGAAKGFAAPEMEWALSRAHELCLRTGKTAVLP